MSLQTILDIQSKIEEVGTEINNLYLINETFNSRKRDPAGGSFARFTIFDSETQIGSINGTGVKQDVEKGNVIMGFFDDVDQGQRIYQIADLYRVRFDDQFKQIKFKIFRVENKGIVERDRGTKPSNPRNGFPLTKGWFRVDLRMTYEKYSC